MAAPCRAHVYQVGDQVCLVPSGRSTRGTWSPFAEPQFVTALASTVGEALLLVLSQSRTGISRVDFPDAQSLLAPLAKLISEGPKPSYSCDVRADDNGVTFSVYQPFLKTPKGENSREVQWCQHFPGELLLDPGKLGETLLLCIKGGQ